MRSPRCRWGRVGALMAVPCPALLLRLLHQYRRLRYGIKPSRVPLLPAPSAVGSRS